MKKYVLALLSLLLLLAILPACGGVTEPSAPTWQEQYDLGVRYLSEGNYQEAIIAFTAAIEIDPKRAEAYLELANVYVATNDINTAITTLDRGIVATEDSSLQNRKDELSEYPVSSVAEGATVQTARWGNVDQSLFAICEEILTNYRDEATAELAEYIYTALVVPAREIHPAEESVFYYGELNAEGVPNGFGICVYAEGEKRYTAAYVGTFKQGLREGDGLAIECLSPSDTEYCGYYIGGWTDDQPYGYGEEYLAYSESRINCSKGSTVYGAAQGYWIECWYENGQLNIEDGDESDGTAIAGYRYLCEDGEAVSMGPVPETVPWYGYQGIYGITEPAGDLMTEYYIVYEDGTEVFEPAPHEHAGGIDCRRCLYGNTGDGFHAYEPLEEDEPHSYFGVRAD